MEKLYFKTRAFGPFVLSLQDIKPHLLVPNLSEAELVKSVREISAKFTVKRDHINDYVREEKMVSAYASFYLPTNIPKLHFLLSKLSEEVLEDLIHRPLIDSGCGPGTFSLGWSLLFEKVPPEIVAIDSSRLMLDQAERILQGFFPKINLKTTQKFNEKKSNSVLLFGHSINEMGIHKAQDQIMMIDPEYVLWIEPGTSDLFKDLIKLRENLLESYEILYPCPSSAKCPSQWCHQVLRTSHNLEIERLSQLVSLDRKTLPINTAVFKRKRIANKSLNNAVITRYIKETKFSFEYEVCFLENGQNKNVSIEIYKKQLSKDAEKFFKNSDVGERIEFEVEKVIGEKLRVLLK